MEKTGDKTADKTGDKTGDETTAKIEVRGKHFTVETGRVAQHDRFWDKVQRGLWETATFQAIDEHTDSKTLAVDCGAWIGPTSLYMAQRAGRCLAFEPDPVAHEVLLRNVALNAKPAWAKRLAVFNAAIHPSGEPIRIAGAGGNSMTSALNVHFDSEWTVETRRLQDVLAAERGSFPKVFVKIDVEGGEYDILPGIADLMADPSVSFLISFHHRRLKLALEHADAEQAAEALVDRLTRVVDALPWARAMRGLDGVALEEGAVRQAVAKGRPFVEDLLIG